MSVMNVEKIKMLQVIDSKVVEYSALKKEFNSVYLDEEYQDLLKKLAERQLVIDEKLAPIENEMEMISNDLRQLVLDLGEGFDHLSMDIKYKKAYKRETWNTEKLKEYFYDLQPTAMGLRTVKEFPATVKIVHRSVEVL